MAYISKTDLQEYLTEHQLDVVQRGDETGNVDYITAAINKTISYMRSRLAYKFDMTTELAKTGAARNDTLIDIMCQLTVKRLLVPFDLYDDGRDSDYMEANKKLDKIEAGDLLFDELPALDTVRQRVIYGTNENLDVTY